LCSIVFAALETISVWLPRDEVRDRSAEDERWLLERGIAVRWVARTAPSLRGRVGHLLWHCPTGCGYSRERIVERALLTSGVTEA
jgi:hypothetical protein